MGGMSSDDVASVGPLCVWPCRSGMTKQIDDIRAEVQKILDEYEAIHGRAATPAPFSA